MGVWKQHYAWPRNLISAFCEMRSFTTSARTASNSSNWMEAATIATARAISTCPGSIRSKPCTTAFLRSRVMHANLIRISTLCGTGECALRSLLCTAIPFLNQGFLWKDPAQVGFPLSTTAIPSRSISTRARGLKLIPPINKDSLGVWLADTRWGNFMGNERWREALVMDLGRGNLLFPQLWGDIYLLNESDVDFLSKMRALAQKNETVFLGPRAVFGDPWKNEVYG